MFSFQPSDQQTSLSEDITTNTNSLKEDSEAQEADESSIIVDDDILDDDKDDDVAEVKTEAICVDDDVAEVKTEAVSADEIVMVEDETGQDRGEGDGAESEPQPDHEKTGGISEFYVNLLFSD